MNKQIKKYLTSLINLSKKRPNNIIKLIIIIALILSLYSDTPAKNKALEKICEIVDTGT